MSKGNLTSKQMTLQAITARHNAIEAMSPETVVDYRALAKQAHADRIWLLRSMVESTARSCPTCQSPEPHRHPTNDFGEPTQSCKDPWHQLDAVEPAANHSKGFVYTGELHIVGHGGIIYGRWVRAEDVGAQPPAGCAECGVTKDQHDNPDEFVPRAAPLPKACALPNCTVLCRHAHDVDGPWVLPAVPPSDVLSHDALACLWDGNSVLQDVQKYQSGRQRTSPENVSDVLDAVVRLIRATQTKPASDRFPDATPAHTCVDGINRVGTPEGCSVCSGETAPYLGKQIEQAQQQLAETPAYVKGPHETVAAQHEETGRMWEGPRDQVPPGYSAVCTCARAIPPLAKRWQHDRACPQYQAWVDER